MTRKTIEVSLTQEEIGAAVVGYAAQKYGTVSNAHIAFKVNRDEKWQYSIKATLRGEVEEQS